MSSLSASNDCQTVLSRLQATQYSHVSRDEWALFGRNLNMPAYVIDPNQEDDIRNAARCLLPEHQTNFNTIDIGTLRKKVISFCENVCQRNPLSSRKIQTDEAPHKTETIHESIPLALEQTTDTEDGEMVMTAPLDSEWEKVVSTFKYVFLIHEREAPRAVFQHPSLAIPASPENVSENLETTLEDMTNTLEKQVATLSELNKELATLNENIERLERVRDESLSPTRKASFSRNLDLKNLEKMALLEKIEAIKTHVDTLRSEIYFVGERIAIEEQSRLATPSSSPNGR